MLHEPAFKTLEPFGIAQPQIFVTDPLAAGQQRIGELDRLKSHITRHMFEPFGGVARRVLQLDDFKSARGLERVERLLRHAMKMNRGGEPDRIFKRELGAGADGEMRGMGSIADQHDIAVMPALTVQNREIQPGRAAKMARIAHQPVTVQMRSKQFLADTDRFVSARMFEAQSAPGGLAAFNDKGRCPWLETIGMRPNPAM